MDNIAKYFAVYVFFLNNVTGYFADTVVGTKKIPTRTYYRARDGPVNSCLISTCRHYLQHPRDHPIMRFG